MTAPTERRLFEMTSRWRDDLSTLDECIRINNGTDQLALSQIRNGIQRCYSNLITSLNGYSDFAVDNPIFDSEDRETHRERIRSLLDEISRRNNKEIDDVSND